MFRDRVTAIFNSRAFRIVFSLLVAFALWIYVEYMENEDVQSRKIEVEVDYLNDALVTDHNLIITEYRTTDITFVFSGKRSVISKLYTSGAVRVVADLSEVKEGFNEIQYTIVYGNGINQSDLTIDSSSDEFAYVMVEKLEKKTVQVVARAEGQLALDGYQAETPTISPDTITVYGTKAEVERVANARVNILRENLTKTVSDKMEFELIDADGEVIVSELLTTDRDTVTVTIPIRMIKDVTLTVSPIWGAGATVENTIITVSPETITIAGEPEELAINSISLTTIDLTMFESFHTVTVPIILSNDITNVSGITEAEVTISIKGLETKTFTVPRESIQVVNEHEGFETSLYTENLLITIRGPAEELDGITVDNIRVVLDLEASGATIGNSTQKVSVRVDGDTATSCGAIGEYSVTVRVSEADGT